MCVYICVCLSSGINRSLFRSRSSWRIPNRHVVTRASLLFECGADIGCRYAAPIALNIRSISLPPPSFSAYPHRFTILLILFRDLRANHPYSSYVCAFVSMCRHVFRLLPPLVIADSRLPRMVINEVGRDRCRIGHSSGS